MRIAIFSWESLYALAIGGVSAHVDGLAAALAAAGHEVHVFTRQGENQAGDDLIGGVYYHRCPQREHADFFAQIAAFNQSLEFYFNETAAAVGGFALLHCHDWLTFIAGNKLRSCYPHLRWIITFHTTEWGRSAAWPEIGEARKIADVEKAAVARADGIIFISYEIRRQANLLYQVPEWKSRVIYHGIKCLPLASTVATGKRVRRELGLAENTPLGLFVGTLNQRKGADILNAALPEIFAAVPAAKFIIIGDGEFREIISKTARDANRENAVIFFAAADAAAEIYSAIDVVAIPYRYDPFGIVALSAWAAAKPVVVCGNGAASEFVYHEVNGFKTEPANFAARLIQLLSTRDHARWLGQNGRAAADTAFSWTAIAEQTAEVYTG